MVKLEVAFVSKYFDYVDSRPPPLTKFDSTFHSCMFVKFTAKSATLQTF